MTTQQQIRKVKFPIYGNLCMIHTLMGLDIKVETDITKGYAIALFDCNNLQSLKAYECLKKILSRRYSGISATA